MPRPPLEFDEKAWQDLDAVERLQIEGGGRVCLSNAVANRAYYAGYHAVAHLAQKQGFRFTAERRPYYRHDTLPGDALRCGILNEDQHLVLEELLGMWVKADYEGEHVDEEEAERAAVLALNLVEELLG